MKKTIKIAADQVTTLKELAKELAKRYGWESYKVRGDTIYFKAESDGKKVNGWIDLSGFAYDAETEEDLDEWNVNWDEDFDGWSNHVWAETKDGETVMLHD